VLFGLIGSAAPAAISAKPAAPAFDVVLAGPECAGKSVVIDLLCLAAATAPQASGLRVAVADPLHLAEVSARTRAALGDLRASGRHTTTAGESTVLSLFDGGREWARLRVRDAVGQVLTRTTAHSPAADRAAHAAYLDRLARADTWWMVVPTPPARHAAADEQWLYQDVDALLAHARAALPLRDPDRPVTVAVLVSKLDARYATPEDARERLPREFGNWLVRQFRTLAADPGVGDVSVFPMTALGFGTMRERAAAVPDGLARGGRVFVLKPGANPRPWNLQPAVVWTLLTALGHRRRDEFGGEVGALVDLGRRLRNDLAAMNGWRTPVKGE
jgi:hypothetical protein